MKKRGKRKRGIENIADIISSSQASDILKLGVAFFPVVEKWKDIMGEEFYSQTSFSGYRKGIFYIKVPDNATLNRLIYEKDKIITKLREIVTPELIEDIFFELEEANEKSDDK